MNEILEKIGELGLVPVVKIEDAQNALSCQCWAYLWAQQKEPKF